MFKVARLPFVFFAIIGSVQCSLGERVRAQDIDPNILSRVESFVPEPAPAVIPKRREVIEEKRLIPGREVTRTVPIPIEELDEQARANRPNLALPRSARTNEDKRSFYRSLGLKTEKAVTQRLPPKVVISKKVVTTPGKTEVKIVGVSAYAYESNADKVPTDPTPDSIANNNAILQIKILIGKREDTLVFFGGPTLVRYASLDTRSFDSLTQAATYTHAFEKRHLGAFKTPGTATQDSIAVSVQGLEVYEPGFGERIRAVTPSVQWQRRNIPLGQSVVGAPGNEAYRYSTTVNVAATKGWASISSQDAFTTRLGMSVEWRTPINGLAISAGASVQGSFFTNFPGDRTDFIVIPTFASVWTPKPNLALTVGASYTDQSSTALGGMGWLPDVSTGQA
jgi:hypothetical protein